MRWIILSFILVLFPFQTASAAPQPPADKVQAYSHFVNGLDALESARFSEALSAFSDALKKNSSDPQFVLARGVTATLAEQFQLAAKDFKRLKRLAGMLREPVLWTYVMEAMSGIIIDKYHAPGGHMNHPPGDVPPVGLPGHIVQGNKEYSTEFASFIVYNLATPYQKTRISDKYISGKRPSKNDPEIRKALAKAGKWFANRNKTRPELAYFFYERVKKSYRERDYKKAFEHLVPVRAAYPNDADVHYYSGAVWLELGRSASARKELTIALTLNTQFAEAYALRALTCANLGDENRARKDFKLAQKLKPDFVNQLKKQFDKAIAENKMKKSVGALLTELENAARSKVALDTLTDLAVKVHKAAHANRLHYDEIYQDKLRVLADAVRANPKNPEGMVNLATYLIEESFLRGDSVEPRREEIGYRWQESENSELTRAEQLLNYALKLNPNYVRAIMQKAMVRARFKDTRTAEALAKKALAIAPNHPEALQMYAMYKAQRADNLNAQASGLRQDSCSSSTRTENRHDGVWEVTTTTCYPPTRGDLQQAAQLDAQAKILRRESFLAMKKALKVSKGTLIGHLLESTYYLWSGKPKKALPVLQKALKRWPDSLKVHDALVKYFQTVRHFKLTEEHKALRNQLIHTTADPMLRLSWGLIPRTEWDKAKEVLAKARNLDPLDARVPAYLGVVYQNEGDMESARAAFRTAIALEEARFRLDDHVDPKKRLWNRDPMDFGTALKANLLLADSLEKEGRPDEALAYYRANAVYAERTPPAQNRRAMFSAFFPDPEAPLTPIPLPKNAATLLAESPLKAGKILRDQGKKEDAIKLFLTSASFGRPVGYSIPNIVTWKKGEDNFSKFAKETPAEAYLELTKIYMEKGKFETAHNYFRAAIANYPSKNVQRQIVKLDRILSKKEEERYRKQYQQSSPQQYQPRHRHKYEQPVPPQPRNNSNNFVFPPPFGR